MGCHIEPSKRTNKSVMSARPLRFSVGPGGSVCGSAARPDGHHLWCERHRLVVVFPCGWGERSRRMAEGYFTPWRGALDRACQTCRHAIGTPGIAIARWQKQRRERAARARGLRGRVALRFGAESLWHAVQAIRYMYSTLLVNPGVEPNVGPRLRRRRRIRDPYPPI